MTVAEMAEPMAAMLAVMLADPWVDLWVADWVVEMAVLKVATKAGCSVVNLEAWKAERLAASWAESKAVLWAVKLAV